MKFHELHCILNQCLLLMVLLLVVAAAAGGGGISVCCTNVEVKEMDGWWLTFCVCLMGFLIFLINQAIEL